MADGPSFLALVMIFFLLTFMWIMTLGDIRDDLRRIRKMLEQWEDDDE